MAESRSGQDGRVEIEIPVQVNGKFRAVVRVPSDATEEALGEAAQADPKVQAAMSGKETVKIIVVPGKLVNIVVKELMAVRHAILRPPSGDCWSRRSLIALEIGWRWLFGAPALLLLDYEGARILAATASQLDATGIEQFPLQDPMRGADMVADAFAIFKPAVLHSALWLLPRLPLWSIASGIGRNLVLRRYDRSLPKKPCTRRSAVAAYRCAWRHICRWFVAIHWAANYSLSGGEPNFVLYCALVICLSLGIFTLWALLSWIFSIAPLLVLLENCSIG